MCDLPIEMSVHETEPVKIYDHHGNQLDMRRRIGFGPIMTTEPRQGQKKLSPERLASMKAEHKRMMGVKRDA